MRAKNWPKLDRLMQPEITTASMLAYVRRVEPDAVAIGRYPQLESLSADCESTAEFRACPLG